MHPESTKKRIRAPRSFTPEQRFWSKVDRSAGPNGCWLWVASQKPKGYGQFSWDGKLWLSHRLSYFLAYGPIPADLLVLHNCPDGDNPACVNPAHLWLGSVQDNNRDMRDKGRQAMGAALNIGRGDNNPSRLHPERLRRGDNHPSRLHPERLPRGMAHGRAKLTDTNVQSIRQQYASGALQKHLAAAFGVQQTLISAIVRRKIWQHIP